MANELCEDKDDPDNSCHGKCHLFRLLQKEIDTQKDQPKIVKIDYFKILHTIQKPSSLIDKMINTNRLPGNYLAIELNNLLRPKLPPPKKEIEN